MTAEHVIVERWILFTARPTDQSRYDERRGDCGETEVR
eukprot:SAG31_NODE_35543_length_322_cov_0.686099_1_plen_37_part_01